MILMNHCIQSGFSLSTIKELICCSFSITYTEELKDIIITGDFTATKLTICLTMNTYRLLFLVSANALCLEYFVLLFFSFSELIPVYSCLIKFLKIFFNCDIYSMFQDVLFSLFQWHACKLANAYC